MTYFNHPNIIRLYVFFLEIFNKGFTRYEVLETPTEIFLVIEYVAGGELSEKIIDKKVRKGILR